MGTYGLTWILAHIMKGIHTYTHPHMRVLHYFCVNSKNKFNIKWNTDMPERGIAPVDNAILD